MIPLRDFIPRCVTIPCHYFTAHNEISPRYHISTGHYITLHDLTFTAQYLTLHYFNYTFTEPLHHDAPLCHTFTRLNFTIRDKYIAQRNHPEPYIYETKQTFTLLSHIIAPRHIQYTTLHLRNITAHRIHVTSRNKTPRNKIARNHTYTRPISDNALYLTLPNEASHYNHNTAQSITSLHIYTIAQDLI